MIEDLIFEIKTIVYEIRVQDYGNGMRGLKDLLDSVSSEYGDILIKLTQVYGGDAVAQRLEEISDTMKTYDMVLVADLLEGVCLPALESLLIPDDPIEEGDYLIESTASGWKTIKSKTSGAYLHSNNDPMWEAEQQAKLLYSAQATKYCLWGLGLGYLAYRLYKYTDGAEIIRVFEEDEDMVRLADKYGMGAYLRDAGVEIAYDPEGRKFAGEMQDDDCCVFLHEPSVRKNKDIVMRDAFLELSVDANSVNHYSRILKRNYRKNNESIHKEAGEIGESIKGKDVIIVAAGPSLDSQMDYLRSVCGVKPILCVGTVLRKLIGAGIRPNFVFFLDPNPVIMYQIKDVETSEVPAVIASTAYWRIAEEYKGEKYIAYQKSYQGKTGQIDKDVDLYNTGGNVSMFILDVAFKQGATTIELVGLDLAYLNGISHAEQTHDRHKQEEERMIAIPGNGGEDVYTTVALNRFRTRIEKEIRGHSDIPVYNRSASGAVIKGTTVRC